MRFGPPRPGALAYCNDTDVRIEHSARWRGRAPRAGGAGEEILLVRAFFAAALRGWQGLVTARISKVPGRERNQTKKDTSGSPALAAEKVPRGDSSRGLHDSR